MKSLNLLSLCLVIGLMNACSAQEVTASKPTFAVTEAPIPQEGNEEKQPFENLKPDSYKVINSSRENETFCHLIPKDTGFYDKVMDSVKRGDRLITFTLNFPDYAENPLLVNMSNNYKSNEWYRTYDLHAYTLLSFPFNYQVLSLTTLAYGTTEMTANVIDSPKGCFADLNVKKKLIAAAQIVATDFDVKRTTMYGKQPHACHQFVNNVTGFGIFEFRCCRIRESDGQLECNEHQPALWVRELYKYVAALQVLAFLTGPLVLGGLFFTTSLRRRGYEVKLDEPIRGTLQVDHSNGNANSFDTNFKTFKSAIKRPQLLDKRLAETKSGRRNIAIKKLMIHVDERSLIRESTVPVGLFKFIYNDLFFCGIKKWEPFTSCFKASFCGPLNGFGLQYLTWGAFMTTLGATLGVLILPFPFYIRMAVYYRFERDEIIERKSLLDYLGLDTNYEHNLLYYLSPSHPFFIAVFSVYIVSIPVLMLLGMFNTELFKRVTVDAFRDLNEVFRLEGFRLFFAYLFLPLEKFGICGVFVGLLYWPVTIPFFFVIGSIYCIPTLYMTCRFLVLRRPDFLKSGCCRCPTSQAVENLHKSRFPQYESLVDSMSVASKKKVETLEDSLLLNNISRKMTEDDLYQSDSDDCCCSKLGTIVLRFLLGVTCIALMYSVLAIFSEAVGFFIEVLIFTIMGAIINANSSAKFIAVVFMLVAYCSSCFNSLHSKYVLLNEMIFKQIKDKLHNKVREATKQRLDMQISAAFKYLSLDEEQELQSHYVENTRLKYGDPSLSVDVSSIYDHLENINGKLYWRVNSLIFFVDKRDIPRIPMDLFIRVTDSENIPDVPGSIPRNMMNAFKQLFYMVVFLSFVVLVIVTFHTVYLMSTTNQLLLTLGGGFVPLLIKSFMTPALTTKSYADKGFINYAFEGRVNEIVEDFQQTWPVYDLDFEYEDDYDTEENQIGAQDDNASVQTSFRPPRVNLNFNVASNRPVIKSLTGGYDEPFNPDNVELVPLTEGADGSGVKIKPGIEALRAQDQEVTLDFANGKCGVRDLRYL